MFETAINFDHGAKEVISPEAMDTLITELAHFRSQTVWLARVNKLQSRLAGANDLNSMIEAFSIWLMPLVEHDLIAYTNFDRNRIHKYCSCHGPARRSVIESAGKVFSKIESGEINAEHICSAGAGRYAQVRQCDSERGNAYLLLLRNGTPISKGEMEIVERGIEILNDPLRRVMDYEDMFDQARRDRLTGLANRRVFEERIDELLSSARRYGHPITIASMDLDNFKNVNDSLGHAAGDKALVRVAKALKSMVRESDLLVRMGGDEFIMVLPSTSIDAALILADRISLTIDQLDIQTPGGGRLGISIGLTQWQQCMSRDDWFLIADETLYRAKDAGRSRICVAEMD